MPRSREQVEQPHRRDPRVHEREVGVERRDERHEVHDLAAAVPVREGRRRSRRRRGRRSRARPPLPDSCGSRSRRGAFARRATACPRPPRARARSARPRSGCPSLRERAPVRQARRGVPLSRPKEHGALRADEHRVVDVDRVWIARIVVRDDDVGARGLEELAAAARARLRRRRGPALRASRTRASARRPRRAAVAPALARACRSSTRRRRGASRDATPRSAACGRRRARARKRRHDEPPHREAGVARRARDVRREDDVLHRQQLLADRRLVLEDVECGTCDRAGTRSATTSADSSTTCPRAVLTRTAVGFIATRASASIR